MRVDEPLADMGDLAPELIAETPVSVRAIVAQMRRAPRAAAVAATMLRAMEAMDDAAALACESLGYGLLQGSAEHRAWLAARVPPPPSPPGAVRLVREDDRLRVTLDRPAARNAIDVAMRDALREAFALARIDPAIATVRLDATGPAFSIGGDLAEFGITRDPATAHLIRSATLPAAELVGRRFRFEAHVAGACVGAGLEIAAFADRLTATRDAWFQLPELAMGLVPGAGGCVSVPRRIGRRRAALMILSGRRIGAATALRWGLVDALVDDPAADDRRADEVGG